ncbi:hypothetical protein OAS39_07885 [Pirellulales bacterium]|nr:hypothetical protein [Pirellulales bacterium]
MIDELIVTISRYSNEPNPSASELMRALISAAYESKELLELSSVPPRGHWGGPTAKLFEDSLKSAIQQAIAQHQVHRRGQNLR